MEYFRKYRLLHKDQIRQNQRKYQQNNEQAIIRKRLRERLRGAFRDQGIKKTQSSGKYGIDFKAIILALGPCPGKRSEWDIDHILPLSSFDLTDLIQLRLAMLPQNHQWLRKIVNLTKRDHYDQDKWTQYVNKYTESVCSCTINQFCEAN